MKRRLCTIALTLGIGSTLSISLGILEWLPILSSPAYAQSRQPTQSRSRIRYGTPKGGQPLPSSPSTNRRGSLIVRGGCAADTTPNAAPPPATPLTSAIALVPEVAGTGGKTIGGNTIAAHPTVWFYVPYSRQDGAEVTFVLQDGSGNEVYRSPIELPEVAGVLPVTVPSDRPALSANTPYLWFLTVTCDRNIQELSGWVQREVNDAFSQKAQAAQPLDRAVLYAQAGYWYDALTVLATLRKQQPDNRTLQEDWAGLLEQVGLQDIAMQPIVP